MKTIRDLYEDIRKKSMERLKFEEMHKDPKLLDPHSPWYKKEEEFAMATYSYYECYKCKKAYFGGKKNCEAMLEESKVDNKKKAPADAGAAGARPPGGGEFKPEELMCPKCSDVGLGQNECKTHGSEYISFKCRYCCSIAQWFCFGTTHFCDPCHQRAWTFHSMKEKDLPQCQPDKCPLKIEHPPNGKEFSLGCGLCNHIKDARSKQDF
jgi:E3 ubiquitin-protein ligase MYCBP2